MMKEILITSSALILALLVLRQVFRKTLSRRVQYALWGLVLVRLLVPVSLPAADFSVMTATAPVQQAVDQRVNQPLYFRPQGQVSREELEERNIDPRDVPTSQDLFVMGESDPDDRFSTHWLVRDPENNTVTRYAQMTVGPWDILDRVWKAGMAVMGAFFVLSNLRFYLRLRKSRREWASTARPYKGQDGKRCAVGPDDSSGQTTRKVYVVPDGVIPSPCLFGRSIYLTPAVAEDPDKLRHVLAHEGTHAKHLDPVWSLLRCVCLTVYWFDPLVWAAAACSRTDCELACDEGALEVLGEAERIPYGRTLLSLIPVKRVSNPMLAATTMTAGKKQLKDRITRIAKRPRQFLAAALAVAVLVAIVSACTFTGGTAGESVIPSPSPSQGPTESALRSLTGEELRWFNEAFFNHNENPAISYTYTIRNQFANPGILYERPEEIDLYELLYLEGSAPTDDELSIVWEGDPADLPCPAYKLTTAEIDAILTEYAGLSLKETNKVGLENFTYSEEQDAYYWMHGDTNYGGELDFTVGTREGDTVQLYHGSSGYGHWYCVTLEEQESGGYHFRSNVECDPPTIPPVLPATDPVATIPLADIAPYIAPTVTVETRAGDVAVRHEDWLDNWNFDDHLLRIYRSGDGDICAAYEEDDGYHVFLSGLTEDAAMFFYRDLLGHDGFYVEYQGQYSEYAYGTVRDYYYFNPDGVLVLLARCECHGSDVFALDLDGDGKQELCAEEQIFFQREGTVYEARLPELLTEVCPELDYWDYASWNKYSKCLFVSGLSMGEDPEAYGYDWTRYLYFDGETLLVYKDEKPTEDHMVVGADAGVPALVVEKAREAALAGLVEVDGFYRRSTYQEHETDGVVERFDDWRVGSFYPTVITLGGVTVEAWGFGSEVHAVEPNKVVIAGGNYLNEDGWTWNYTADNTIFLRREADGSLTYLWTGYDDGTLDSHVGRENLARSMEEHGVELDHGYTYAGLQIESDLTLILDHSNDRVILQLTSPEGYGGVYTVDPAEGNGPYYRNYFSQPSEYRWSRVEGYVAVPDGATLVVTDEHWYQMLQFWAGSDLVMSKRQNRDPEWYRAEPLGLQPDDIFYERVRIFNFMRQWFDEAELDAKRLPDSALEYIEGESYLELAHRWAACYEMPRMNLTPGSSAGACIYVKVTDEEVIEDMPETWFPQDILQYPHFAFSYTTIFVPSDEHSLSYMMAGNTGEYEGNDPEVPEGAFEYYRRGSLYLKDGYWYCGSIGTG